MNMRMLSILSLLLTINIMNGSDVREQYQKLYINAQGNVRVANKDVAEALENIYQTEKGKRYKESRKAWHTCIRNAEIKGLDSDESSIKCKKLRKIQKNALKDLKEIPEYTEFGRLLKLAAYYDNLKLGL